MSNKQDGRLWLMCVNIVCLLTSVSGGNTRQTSLSVLKGSRRFSVGSPTTRRTRAAPSHVLMCSQVCTVRREMDKEGEFLYTSTASQGRSKTQKSQHMQLNYYIYGCSIAPPGTQLMTCCCFCKAQVRRHLGTDPRMGSGWTDGTEQSTTISHLRRFCILN